VPCRGVRAQGFLALRLDGGYEGGAVLLHGFLCPVISDLREAIGVPAHFFCEP
jgi:hypothetical protein